MNSTSIFNDTIHLVPLTNHSQIHIGNITNQSLSASNLSKVAKSKIERNDSIYSNIPRSKRHAQQVHPRSIPNVIANKNNTLSPSTSSNTFEELLSHMDLNDNSINNDLLDNDIPRPSRGLQNNNDYPEFLADAKNKIELILTQLQSPNQITPEKNWEDLAKTLKAVKEYQYLNPRNMDVMKESLENIFKLFSNTSIKTKSQFLVFENWVSILSYNPSSSISLKNNPKQAEVYLSRLHEILKSADKEIQDSMHDKANVLFKYEFLEQCSYEEYARLRGKLFDVVKKTFNLFETFKEKSYYYFIRNGLLSYKSLIQFSEKTAFKEDIIHILERGFRDLFQRNVLTSEQKIVAKQLFYLATKEQDLTSLSEFCQSFTVKDMYPYQREVVVENMRVNVSSSQPFSDSIIAQLPKKLEDTRSYFIEAFKEIVNNKGNNTFHLFVAEDKFSYETFNYALLGTSTGNGGALNYLYTPTYTPTITVYVRNGKILNLEHECNHALFDFYIDFKDRLDKYGRLDWLNEGLSYVLVPDNPIQKEVKSSLTGKELPSIKDIIEASNQDYYISYAFTEYLLKKQKPILEEILMDKKNKQRALLTDKLGKLIDLEDDFHTYLITRWSLPESMRKSTTTRPQPVMPIHRQSTTLSHPLSQTTMEATTAEHITASNLAEDVRYAEWTPEKGSNAVKKIVYGSAVPLGVGLTGLVYAIFGISKRKGGNGRGGHNRFKEGSRRYRNEPVKHPEIKPLTKKTQNRFFFHDSKSSQRQGNTWV